MKGNLPNGISGSEFALPTERHDAEIFLANKVILCKFYSSPRQSNTKPQLKGRYVSLQKNCTLIYLLALCIL